MLTLPRVTATFTDETIYTADLPFLCCWFLGVFGLLDYDGGSLGHDTNAIWLNSATFLWFQHYGSQILDEKGEHQGPKKLTLTGNSGVGL